MLHREDQVHFKANQYDIVRSKKKIRVVPGVMNSYNKTIESFEFTGYALVLNTSNTFAHVYLPNRTLKMLKIENLIVVSKWK
jgi:hypothetical protein